MVRSSSISITPANHADRHRVGGADPLTGSVGIDKLFTGGLSAVAVHSGNVPVAWTEVDLSGITGAHKCACNLRCASTTGAIYLSVRTKSGQATNSDTASACGASGARIENGKTAILTTISDAAGKIEIYAAIAQSATIYLDSYVQLD